MFFNRFVFTICKQWRIFLFGYRLIKFDYHAECMSSDNLVKGTTELQTLHRAQQTRAMRSISGQLSSVLLVIKSLGKVP